MAPMGTLRIAGVSKYREQFAYYPDEDGVENEIENEIDTSEWAEAAVAFCVGSKILPYRTSPWAPLIRSTLSL